MENSEKLLAGICDLKGSQMAQMAFLKALIQVLPEAAIEPLKLQLELQSEIVKTVLLNSPVSEQTRDALSRDLALFQVALSER